MASSAHRPPLIGPSKNWNAQPSTLLTLIHGFISCGITGERRRSPNMVVDRSFSLSWGPNHSPWPNRTLGFWNNPTNWWKWPWITGCYLAESWPISTLKHPPWRAHLNVFVVPGRGTPNIPLHDDYSIDHHDELKNGKPSPPLHGDVCTMHPQSQLGAPGSPTLHPKTN